MVSFILMITSIFIILGKSFSLFHYVYYNLNFLTKQILIEFLKFLL